MKKKQSQDLSGREKLELAEKTIIQILEQFHFVGHTLSKFLYTVRKREKDTFFILEKIDGGINKWPSGSMRSDIDRALARVDRMNLTQVPSMIGAFLMGKGTKVNGCRLNAEDVKGDGAKEARDILQLCFIQMIALDSQVESKHFQEYRSVVKLLRNALELSRMELHLNNLPTYTPPIKQADLFVWILEERVRIWDSVSRKKSKAK
ncbi:hypothetical protein KK083_15295 [Fulvivirgaceae bacterium PWU4]|uniref:Uncharacterized protein n=1 Tax=Chryseosolibacter histidini TaxID=2782349 RepID=A0AAP2GQ88_9BACT|nr:hypothetical protein [Chryseosolibacter histidini]MBT1698257.1 hypothetical protein [Chryseosolibacter histidini]